MTKKLVDIEKLVGELNKRGMIAGYSPVSGSSYPLVIFSDNSELWGYFPSEISELSENEEDDLLGTKTLNLLL